MSGIDRQSRLKRAARMTVVALAAGAMTLSSVADGFARSLGGGGRGFGGDGMRSPGNGGRFPGNDGPRFPGGGGGPRFPGGGAIMLPPHGYGPSGPGTGVIADDDDQGATRHRTKKATKKQKPQKQLAQRG